MHLVVKVIQVSGRMTRGERFKPAIIEMMVSPDPRS